MYTRSDFHHRDRIPRRHFRRRATWLVAAALLAGSAARATAGGDKEVPPELGGFDALRLARVDSIIQSALRGGAAPGAALVVGRYGHVVRLRGYGQTQWHPLAPLVTDSTLYDLASLTKSMGTATVALQLVREGRLALDRPIAQYLRTWPRTGLHGRITARHLLAHASGLPEGFDVWPGPVRSRADRIASLARLNVRSTPGTSRVYGDVGMIVLGAVLEAVTQSRLDDLLAMRVFAPLGMAETGFNPLLPHGDAITFQLARIAPTELDTHVRRALVHGVVHDLNAWALDGVAGHAGLFSSARDMAAFGQAMLNAAHGRDTPIFLAGAFQPFLATERAFGRPLGWDVPTSDDSSAGRYLTAASFGHTGFTGTSIWIDPELDLFVVLLTNRLHPSARNQKHVQLRRDLHNAVALAIADVDIRPRGED